MAWTTPKTWTYKESLASNDMNIYVRDNFNFLKDAIDNKILAGSGMLWFTDTAPDGWLLCRGQAISRTTYSTLFAAIGTTYGVGDNSTTFNLPQGGGKVFVGKDAAQTEFDTLGETGGAKTVTLAATQIPAHTHSGNTGNVSADHSHTFSGTTGGQSQTHTHGPGGSGVEFICSIGSGGDTSRTSGSNATKPATTGNASADHSHGYAGTTSGISANHTHAFTTDNGTGGSQAHNNLQPYQVANYIIKY